MRDHSVESKVNELVADNKLEEALDLMLSQAGQAQRRENALFVLKGRLASLEEQELGGMLSFEELARQKAVLAHRILDIADGSSLDVELPKPSPTTANRGIGWVKYLLIGIAILLSALAILFFTSNEADKSTAEVQPETQTEIQPLNPPETKREEPIKMIEKTDPPRREETVENKSQSENAPVLPKKEATPPPAPSRVSIPDFPNVGRKFLYRDLYLTFQKPTLVLMGSTASPQVKMTLKYDLQCRNNLGYCEREEIKILVDGRPFSPQKNTAGKTLNNGTTITEELVFTLPANASAYHLTVSKADSSGPWKRGFRVLVN